MSTPQKDLKTVKAEQRARRKQEKIEAKQAKKERRAQKRKNGFFKQLREVFTMTREHDPSVIWWMLGAFVASILVGVVIGLLLNNWILWLIIAIPFGLMFALIIMNRKAEKAAFARIDGRPGATGAALNTLGRGWVVPEEPIAINAKTQETVFRATGKAGVVLVAEGNYGRARKLLERERTHMQRYLPGVTIRTLQVGHGKSEVRLDELKKTIKRMEKTMNKHEVRAVEQRLASLPARHLPIPKGIDPNRMRPDRKAMRGR